MIASSRKIKCSNCTRTLMTAAVVEGVLEIKCRKCGAISNVDIKNGSVKITEVSEHKLVEGI